MNSKKKKLNEKIGWAYIRVSTTEQDNIQHGSTEQQNNRIQRWVKSKSRDSDCVFTITRTINEEISGTKKALARRKQYQELKNSIEDGVIDFVVVEKLDRLNRNLAENKDFAELCQKNKVSIYAIDGGEVNLRDRGSRTSFVMQSFMAEEYSIDLQEKMTKKQREARVNNGKDSGSYAILGLDPHEVEACFYKINPEEQKQVEAIFKYFFEHSDLAATAEYANKRGYKTKVKWTKEKIVKGKRVPPKEVGGKKFDSESIRRLLVSRRIAGYGFFEDDWDQFFHMRDENRMVKYVFRHGSVVESKLFEDVQILLKKNAKHNHRNHSNQRTYFLSGVLFDESDHSYCGQSVKNKKNPYYYCKTTKSRIPAEQIEKTVIDYVTSLFKEEGKWSKLITNTLRDRSSKLYRVDDEISFNLREQKRLKDDLRTFDSNMMSALRASNQGLLEELVNLNKKKDDELENLKEQLGHLRDKQDKIGALARKNETQEFLKKVINRFKKSNSLVKKRLIQAIVPRVEIHAKDNKLHIYVNPFSRNCKSMEEKVCIEKEWLGKWVSNTNFSVQFYSVKSTH